MEQKTMMRKSDGSWEPTTLNKQHFSFSQIASVTNEKSLELSGLNRVDAGYKSIIDKQS
jgi:hypothetical protein